MHSVVNLQMLFKSQFYVTQHYPALQDGSQIESDELFDMNMRHGHTLPGEVIVKLNNQELWEKFHALNTEMIITKLGRCMFPSLQLHIKGLQQHEFYCICVELVLTSDRRYKYSGNSVCDEEVENKKNGNFGGWTKAGPAEPQPFFDRRIYLHPDSPATGRHWTKHVVNFKKLKITNNVADPRNNVVLTSMHKYIPQIWIIHCANADNIKELFSCPKSSFVFQETEFIAVTAYQNEQITKLKIDNNPFAKGFRETGQSRCKRKYEIHVSIEANNDDDISDESHTNRSVRKKVAIYHNHGIESSDEVRRSSLTPLSVRESSSIADSDYQNEVSSLALQPHFHRPWLDSSPSSSWKSNVSLSTTLPISFTAQNPKTYSNTNFRPYYLYGHAGDLVLMQQRLALQSLKQQYISRTWYNCPEKLFPLQSAF